MEKLIKCRNLSNDTAEVLEGEYKGNIIFYRAFAGVRSDGYLWLKKEEIIGIKT